MHSMCSPPITFTTSVTSPQQRSGAAITLQTRINQMKNGAMVMKSVLKRVAKDLPYPSHSSFPSRLPHRVKLSCGLLVLCLTVLFAGRLPAQNPDPHASVIVSANSLTDPGPAASAAGAAPTAPGSESKLRVGAGDLLAVTVFDAPELTQTVRVNDVGDASFSFIGLLHVADLTTDQTRDVIARKLTEGNFLLHPEVSVPVSY